MAEEVGWAEGVGWAEEVGCQKMLVVRKRDRKLRRKITGTSYETYAFKCKQIEKRQKQPYFIYSHLFVSSPFLCLIIDDYAVEWCVFI